MATKFELAHDVWPLLVKAAGERRLLSYGELAQHVGLSMAIVMSHALDPIYELCREKGWPHLTGIVVNNNTGVPGSGFEAWKDEKLEDRQKEVFNHNWGEYARPFSPADRRIIEERAEELEDWWVSDQQVIVNGRGPFQDALRSDLLRMYGGRCALCETKHKGLLVASHIVPWSQDPENRRNPRNAILFCRSHDALFELELIRIMPDRSVEVTTQVSDDWGREVLRLLSEQTQDHLLIQKPEWGPDDRLLKWRLDQLGTAE